MHLFLIGAGHVGLVTAVGFARLGHQVTVADVDGARIAALKKGHAPVFEAGLEDAIRACLAGGGIKFTTDPRPPAQARFSLVCVGTPATARGSLSMAQVESVVGPLARATAPDHTIVVRSTLPLDGPDRLLRLAGASGERPRIVLNPEFMREGSALRDFEAPSRVVVGWLEPADRSAAEDVAGLYAPLGAPTLVADARSVALIKLATNVFLAMKVTFANELARICDSVGADVETVTAGIGMDNRIGPGFLRPGPGLGGSCLPEQSVAIAWETAARGVTTPLVEAIGRSNDVHQGSIVRHLEELLRRDGTLAGVRIALLGLAFKAGTDDVRHSPALSLARLLRERGASVAGYDPEAGENARRTDPELEVASDVESALRDADAVIIATEWRAFAALDWTRLTSCLRGDLVYDLRRVGTPDAIRAAGLRYEALGRG
jgi:UDPglucose 6-dehydrogenase